MLDTLLSTAVSNAKLVVAGAIGAALVAGGGAVAVTQVASTSHPSSNANEHATLQGDNRSDTATAQIELPKPEKSPKSDEAGDGAQGVHGACVSAVAQDKSTEGRMHGKAVSEAAHSCPKGDNAADDSDADDDADDAAKPAKPAKGEHGRSGEHKPS